MLPENKVFKEFKVLKDPKELKENWDLKEPKVNAEWMVQRDLRDLMELPVL